jgi:hypothetical protein
MDFYDLAANKLEPERKNKKETQAICKEDLKDDF